MDYDEPYLHYAHRNDTERQRKILNKYLRRQTKLLKPVIGSIDGWPKGKKAMQRNVARFASQLSSWPRDNSLLHFYEDETDRLIAEVEAKLGVYHDAFFKKRKSLNKYEASDALGSIVKILDAERQRIRHYAWNEIG
ncbi:hypothetical protein U8Q05_03690 [Rhizobium ruizarguesonis]|nr:hypothetical protein U8Q05_03690 [Rhizobium ruizarguesonis]